MSTGGDTDAQAGQAAPLDRPTETTAGEASLQIVPAPGERWLNRNVVGMGVTSFLSDAGHEAATAVLPAFLGTIGAPPATQQPHCYFSDRLWQAGGEA